jgi:hypothetical protein
LRPAGEIGALILAELLIKLVPRIRRVDLLAQEIEGRWH